jgi:type III secretion system-like peptide-binding chaperone
MADEQEMRVQCYQWLSRFFPDIYTNAALDIIVPRIGVTSAFVSFEQLATAQILVDVRAPVLENIAVSEALVQYLAWNATAFGTGALSLRSDAQGAWLHFSYALYGETLTQQLINQVVSVVARTADRVARQLQPTFGGDFLHPENVGGA